MEKVYDKPVNKTNPNLRRNNTMKKLFAILFAVAFIFGCLAMTACGKTEESLDAAYTKYLNQYKQTDSSLPTLTVAMSPDFPPMEFVDTAKKGQDQYVGFDVILANYLAKELGMNVEIKPMSFDACLIAVQTGNATLGISGFSWTPERAENYLISDWYKAGENESNQVIITTKANEGKFTTAESLKGAKIGAQGTSLQEQLVKDTFGESQLVSFQDLNTGIEALMLGKVDAFAVAKGNGDAFVSKNPEKLVASGFEFDVAEKYKNNVVLLNKNDAELLEKVNAALAKAKGANIYESGYEACQSYSKIKTADDLGYDDDGNKIVK